MTSGRSRSGPPRRRRTTTDYVRYNRAVWDRVSPWYDRRYRRVLGGKSAMAWGLFRRPERTLQLLGPTRGKKVLELGCGAARWSIALHQRGARTTGLDLSTAQLAKARELQLASHVRFPLVRGSAVHLPFRKQSFDLVFCDWGAMTFTDPMRSVPEVARVLRRRGRFVFATWNPWHFVTLDLRKERALRRLVRPYFGLHRVDYGPAWAVEFNLPYGTWVDLFRRNGLTVERLLETQPTARERTLYMSRNDVEWGRSWPLETIWSLVKE